MLITDPISSMMTAYIGDMSVLSLTLRIFLSILCGAVIGAERATKRHAAGLRTFVFISLSSTLCVLLDMLLFKDRGSNSFILSGMCMLSVAIVSINSILFSSRSQIKGLTTAAALWSTSVLGLLIGAGYYTVALIAIVAIMFSLSALPNLEKYLKDRSNHFEINVELTNPTHLQDLVTTMRELGLVVDDIESNHAYTGSGLSVYSIALSITGAELKKYKTHKEIIAALATLEYIYHIDEM